MKLSLQLSATDNPHRILVVDDNPAIHEDFRKILATDATRGEQEREDALFFGTPADVTGNVPFELDFASQGKEALELVIAAKADERPYSVVFMDVRMPPGWDGIETTSRLWETDPDLQVVICTAYSDYSWEEMEERLGRTDRLLILKKPFDVIEVVQCAHALCGKWSLLQQTRRHAEALESTVQERTEELKTANQRLEKEIEQRRRSEEELRFTQFSVDNALDAVFWVAPNAGLLYVNEATCRISGYSLQELHAMSVMDIVPELREVAWQPFWASMKEERHRILEATYFAKGGNRIPIELTATFFTFEGQELLCVSCRDITRRKEILEELSAARDVALESVRLKGQFLANMSHEIRTPMNGVIGMADLLSHTKLDRDQREYIDTIRNSADSLLNIINDILDTAKIESGMLRFETLDFDLNGVIEDSMDVVGGSARAKGLELAAYVEGKAYPHLRGDAGRLRQVLTNILGNAVKFTEEGEVVLTVLPLAETPTQLQLCFEIRDTGIGISDEARAKIFAPFVQADSSGTRKYGGTGLGLAICRQIVEALGGTIGVESEPGKGSTFWFNLTFKKQASPVPEHQQDISIPKDMRVLVVDDNPTNREILKLQLANLGLRATGVPDGDEALAILRQENSGADPFQCAVLDGQMPGMDGVELARRIKSDPVMAATRLILLSSLGDLLTDETLASAGIEDYLMKPLKQSRLQSVLTALFSREPARAHPFPAGANVPETAPAPAPAAEEPAEAPTPEPALRILLAEDNPVNQRVALLQLKRMGYTADTAENGVEVLKALESVPYNVILMDCQMPEMDGYTAASEVRRLHRRPIHIIAITAHAMQGDREKCLAAGMDEHLSKPVDFVELDRLLKEYQVEMGKVEER